MKTSSDHMVKCWIPKIYLTNPSTKPSTPSHPVYVMDRGLEDTWLMDSDCSRHMTRNKKWFSGLTPLSHKEYVTFGDDKKGKVLCTGVIKVNVCFTLNDVALVDRLRYNLLSVFQFCDTDLSVLFSSLICMFMILLASVFVASLALKMFFKLISHLLNLL
jgi:hypothetical protein